MSSGLAWTGFAKKRSVEAVQSQSKSLEKRVGSIESNIAELSALGQQILEGITSLQKELLRLNRRMDEGFSSGEKANMSAVKSIRSDLVKEATSIRDGSMKQAKELTSTILPLLQGLNDNQLHKEDMEVIASFLRFIAANQLLLENAIYGEACDGERTED